MSKRNSTVKIVDGKVVFSQEIIDYFENLRNEENSEWIDKYFEVLSDENNLTTRKFNYHHIIPAFLFKDDLHKNRKDTVKLADDINENLIKLSISNHIKAHNFLRLILPNNHYARMAVYIACGKRNIDNLTEMEINEISQIIENCSKENQTEEEKAIYMKLYVQKNKERLSKQAKERNEKNKEERAIYMKLYVQKNKERLSKRAKEYYEKNKEEISEKKKKYEENNKEEISKRRKEKYKINKEKISERQKEYNNAFCYDPINNTPCTRNALNLRKRNNKEKYKNVVVSECLISEEDYLKLKEEISKKKKEEKKLYGKKWYENNKEQHAKTGKLWYEKNKDELSKKRKIYRKSNKENISKRGKEYYKNNKEEISEKHKKYNNQLCIDPTNGTKCTYSALRWRKKRHAEKYKDVNPKNCIIKND